MSQFYVGMSGGNVPPEVATTYHTDSGDAVPALNILNVLGIDSSEDNPNGITTTGSGNTVNVVLTNRIQGTSTVVGATTSDVVTFALGATDTVYRFNFLVTGRDTATGDGIGYTVFGSARTDGSTATVVASAFVDNDEDASLIDADIDFVASANNVILRVTGVAGQTISLKALGEYIEV